MVYKTAGQTLATQLIKAIGDKHLVTTLYRCWNHSTTIDDDKNPINQNKAITT